MKKLRLNLEELKINSFQTEKPITEKKGTVKAYAPLSQQPWCHTNAMTICSDYCVSWAATCAPTCDPV